jgi:HD superfamily phosphohydrolase
MQEFLYDIVNNTRTGLDVDKLDYFVRDSTCCGVGTVPEIGRFFDLARYVLQAIAFYYYIMTPRVHVTAVKHTTL